MRRATLLLGSLAVLLSADAAFASWGTLRIPARYRSWTLTSASGDEVSLSQTYAPLVVSIPFAERGDLVLSTSASSSSLDPDETLSGASDMVLQAVYRVSESLLVQGGVNLPTGTTELTLEEFSIVRLLSHPLLGFPIWQHGQGLNLSAGMAWVTELSPGVEAGFGAGVVVHGEYQLLRDVDEQYEPGRELAFSTGLTAGDPRKTQFTADLTYRLYGEDSSGGEPVYEQGAQVEAQMGWRSRIGGSWAPYLGLRGVFKQESTIPDRVEVESLHEAPGNSYMADFGLERDFSSGFRAGITLSARGFSGSETSRQDGSAFGIGPSFRIFTGASGAFEFSPQVWSGTLDANELSEEVDLSGWSVLISYRLQGR